MEAAAAGVSARSVTLPVSSSSQPSQKQWRVVSEHMARSSSSEGFERGKLGQSDERLIYEVHQGREPVDVDFCSITIDESLDNGMLQQRLHNVVKQREKLHQIEFELQAQLIARSEVMEMQKMFDARIKEHANSNAKLQDQLHERECKLLELERKMEERERELHAIRLDNEAAWAKEDLLREQSKELQSYRRERDNSETERVQHVKQIHDLQEHIQEKERQFMELQEQKRVAQETIIFKDEQLREAQAWISRVQEMDVLQSSTNHSLQAELRDRSEQYNQLWLCCQQQFAEMERLHLHIQQLQLELAEAKERSGTYLDGLHVAHANSKDVSRTGPKNAGQVGVSSNITSNGNSSVLQNEGVENTSSLISGGNASNQTDQVHGVPLPPSSLLGMASYLPTGQVTPLHPFVMHQQGVPHSVPSHVSQSHISQFHSVSATSSLQQLQNQKRVVSECMQIPSPNQYPEQTASTLLRSESDYNCETSLNGKNIRPEFLNVIISQGIHSNTVVLMSNEKRESHQGIEQVSSQFHSALRLDPVEQSNAEKNVNHLASHGLEAQGLMTEDPCSTPNSLQSEVESHAVEFSNQTNAGSVVVLPLTGQNSPFVVAKTPEIPLLDERSLLACIVRTIPPGSGGKIRISSTLPNRIAKMLAPLRWHDYKKKYGKLEEFVSSHPELFVIDGDHIQLREGAQETIAATTAVAKVAAAATSHSALLASVAVTPLAQSHRLNKAISIESTAGKTDHPSQLLEIHNQRTNVVSFNVSDGASNVKFIKHKGHMELNGRSVIPKAGNGMNFDEINVSSFQSKVPVNGRPVANVIGKQQGRSIGAATNFRR